MRHNVSILLVHIDTIYGTVPVPNLHTNMNKYRVDTYLLHIHSGYALNKNACIDIGTVTVQAFNIEIQRVERAGRGQLLYSAAPRGVIVGGLLQ